MYGLTTVNVELTNRCNKSCWCCGRRKIEKDHPEIAMNYGDMDFALVEKIAKQVPANIVIQLHNNGESLLYPRFGDAVKLFSKQITNIVTNGKLLVEKADEIIGNLDTVAISIIEADDEVDEQREIIKEFLKLKGDKKPYTILRINGKVEESKYNDIDLLIAKRILHSPMGSFGYERHPTIPEIGVCLDFLHHLAIDREGAVSTCVRFDPTRLGVLGNINEQTLTDIWNCPKRMRWLEFHKRGERDQIPLCSYCDFWGVPTGNYI